MSSNVIQATPQKRVGKPEEIASAVLFLASDEAVWMTGQTLSVSGGFIMI
jgi:NAD(P)-dependent dehydrogenase (short-subunit alcohol dehydrogenase family)